VAVSWAWKHLRLFVCVLSLETFDCVHVSWSCGGREVGRIVTLPLYWIGNSSLLLSAVIRAGDRDKVRLIIFRGRC
jgi:hypothetical protein